ncbi:drug/metabolite transporter (DMT)-like permease [Kineosphaera limosa]|uniref:DMT family transporter n=1 Tax=Kineosphaera limosa TaxID=111564 RepID=UPI000306F9E0|nr:DMT family transporter [Kineosphaera limosa]NYE00607.1 drug/metabolite transporter (DMT)-like permease [Kineosphaera limosa]
MSRGFVLCAVAAVLFGVSAPLASRLAGELGPFTLAGALYVGAAIACAPFARTPLSAGAWRRGARPLAVAVVLGGAVGPLLLAMGLGRTPAATASLLLNLELVFTTLLAGWLFREYIGPRIAAGTALVVVASVVLGWSGDPELRWGALLLAGACLCWAVDNCVTAELDAFTPAQITLVKGVVAGGGNLAIGLLVEGGPSVLALMFAMVVGAFGYGASITLWIAGARDLGAARGQLVFATAPFVGALLAWTVLREPATTRELVALAIAVAGIAFVVRSGHEHAHTHEPLTHRHRHHHGDDHHDHPHGEGAATPGSALGSHEHEHTHAPVKHVHPHLPDLHHRHLHRHR